MRLYVGNLPFNTIEHELRTAFERHGIVSDVKILSDRETGRSRGFGFVEMDDAGAQRAIELLDSTDFGGRRLTVNQAKERPARSGGGGYDPRPRDKNGRDSWKGRDYR